MTEATLYAWIFLSVPRDPSPLQDVLLMSDAINHAVPTQRELQASFGWLKKQGLVHVESKKYSLTEFGESLRQRATPESNLIHDTWKAVAARFTSMIGEKAPEIEISSADFVNANTSYRRAFGVQHQKLQGEPDPK